MELRMKRFLQSLFTIYLLLLAYGTMAQLPPVQHPRNPGLRYEVDAKRMGTDPNSDDALPRSREFKRIDSSYYVGWMYEGFYKYNHAADYLGFRNAAKPLEQAMKLIERDYRKELSTRTGDLMKYFPAYKFHLDYTMTAYYLMNCYSNMEEPQMVYNLLRRVLRWRLQRDYYMDAYNYLGWTVHRNRFYTSAKYPFLKNSIDANEKLAMQYLDSGIRRINRDMALNSTIFQPGYDLQERLAVYHYKSMLYSYAFNIDSAGKYYGLMRRSGVLPHNNYATFMAVCGNFREAEKEYTIESENRQPDKRLQEWAYYLPILYNYQGLPKKGAELAREMIQANGSTPGFGWYNITLARSLLYDGQFQEAERYIRRASEFKELHIGTTLGQTHYDFSVALLKLQEQINKLEAQRFEDRNWWYHPQTLTKMARLQGEKYLQQFLIINQFAQNPERDRVVYKLFSTESTVSWDEIWLLIRDFSTKFFLEKFQKELKTDPRAQVSRYFKYFVAQLYIRQERYKEAALLLNEILLDGGVDADYEKLLLARTLQAYAVCALEMGNKSGFKERMYQVYNYYPQLIPFSGQSMDMRFSMRGAVDKAVEKRLLECNINLTNDGQAPLADLVFERTGNKKKVTFSVRNAKGTVIVPQQTLNYTDPEKGAVQLAYRLFNIGSKGDEPSVQQNRDKPKRK